MNWLDGKVRVAVLLVAGFLAAGSLVRGVWNALCHSSDFRLNYYAAQLILRGENPYRLHLDGTLEARVQAIAGATVQMDPDYFPSALLPAFPLSFLSWEAARVAWLAINLACCALLFLSLRGWMRDRAPPPDHFLLGILLWLAGTPFRNSLGLGQNTIFAMAMLLASLRMADRSRPFFSGLLLALSLYKYALVWPIVFFFYCLGPRRLALAWAALIHFLIHLFLCWKMSAHPILIFSDVLNGNRDVFERNEMITVWMPWRSLGGWLGWTDLTSNIFGALTLLAIMAILAYRWCRIDARSCLPEWLGLLGLFSMIAISTRPYAMVFAPALWFSVVGPQALAARPGERWRIAAYLIWLTICLRVIEALSGPDYARAAILWAYNPVMALLCLEFFRIVWLQRAGRKDPNGFA